MAEISQIGLMPSIIDRLIDPESTGTVARIGYSLGQMIESVRRDLEELLNTRRGEHDIPDEFVELRRSVANYGLPEVVNMPALTGEQREHIGRVLERILSIYEPRLRDVRARLAGPTNLLHTSVRFHIDGRLRVDPAPDVEFETVLELTSGRSTVQAPTTT